MNVSASSHSGMTPAALGYPLLRAQKILGWLGMLVLLAAFASLVDGLTAEMQRGPNRLDVLAGTQTPLSGPIPVKKAELDDFFVQGNAPDGQVKLVLDDFFASYWFGSGMWRGRLVVGDNPGIGEYPMIVEFRDAPPRGAQNYRVVVWPDAHSMREGSFSWITRQYGLSPFLVAAALFPGGLLLAAVNFLVGRRRGQLLLAKGCGEVYKVMRGDAGGKKAQSIGTGKLEATFGLGESHGVRVGQGCLFMRPDGKPVLKAMVVFCELRHASVLLEADADVRPGDVVLPLQEEDTPSLLPQPKTPEGTANSSASRVVLTGARPTPFRPEHTADK